MEGQFLCCWVFFVFVFLVWGQFYFLQLLLDSITKSLLFYNLKFNKDKNWVKLTYHFSLKNISLIFSFINYVYVPKQYFVSFACS